MSHLRNSAAANAVVRTARSSRLALVAGLSLSATLSAATAGHAQLTPLSLSGYNLAGIVNGTPVHEGDTTGATTAITASTGPSTVNNGTLDTHDLFYAKGFDLDAPTSGLPVGTTFSSAAANSFGSGTTVSFAIQPASTTSITPNLLLIYGSATTGTLSLAASGSYNSLAFLVSGFNNSQVFTYTLNYKDGSSTTATATAPDNFNNSNPAYIINGRINQNGGFLNVNSANPRLYEVDVLNADSSKALSSVTFSEPTAVGTNNSFGVFGISAGNVGGAATTAPEPGSIALFALGLMGGAPALLGTFALRRR